MVNSFQPTLSLCFMHRNSHDIAPIDFDVNFTIKTHGNALQGSSIVKYITRKAWEIMECSTMVIPIHF